MIKIDPRVTEEMVRNVPAPEFTSSWHPYSHSRVLDVLTETVKAQNLPVNQKAYSLSDDGNRMYGVWTLREKNTKVIGKDTIFKALFFRNSVDKSYAFGINAGTQVHICTNFTVFGGFIEFRRHTGGLDERELSGVVERGIAAVGPRLQNVLDWHDGMRNIPLALPEAKELAYDAIVGGVISKQRIPEFHQLLFDEGHKYEPTSLFGFHEAATELISGLSLVGDFQGKQNRLHGLIQERYGERLPELVFSEN